MSVKLVGFFQADQQHRHSAETKIEPPDKIARRIHMTVPETVSALKCYNLVPVQMPMSDNSVGGVKYFSRFETSVLSVFMIVWRRHNCVVSKFIATISPEIIAAGLSAHRLVQT